MEKLREIIVKQGLEKVEEIQEILEVLENRENDLMMAGRIGQELLERNNELNEENQRLNEQYEHLNEQYKRLNEETVGKQSDDEIGRLREKKKMYKNRAVRIGDEVKGLMELQYRLKEELEIKEERNRELSILSKAGQAYRKRFEEVEEELEAVNGEVERVQGALRKEQSQNSMLRKQLEMAERGEERMSRVDVESLKIKAEKYSHLKDAHVRLKSRVEKLEAENRQIDLLVEENSNLSISIQSLMKVNKHYQNNMEKREREREMEMESQRDYKESFKDDDKDDDYIHLLNTIKDLESRNLLLEKQLNEKKVNKNDNEKNDLNNEKNDNEKNDLNNEKNDNEKNDLNDTNNEKNDSNNDNEKIQSEDDNKNDTWWNNEPLIPERKDLVPERKDLVERKDEFPERKDNPSPSLRKRKITEPEIVLERARNKYVMNELSDEEEDVIGEGEEWREKYRELMRSEKRYIRKIQGLRGRLNEANLSVLNMHRTVLSFDALIQLSNTLIHTVLKDTIQLYTMAGLRNPSLMCVAIDCLAEQCVLMRRCNDFSEGINNPTLEKLENFNQAYRTGPMDRQPPRPVVDNDPPSNQGFFSRWFGSDSPKKSPQKRPTKRR